MNWEKHITRLKQVAKKIKFRHELKYIMDVSDVALLRPKLSSLLLADSNAGPGGVYKIRSLYFDDYWGSAYADKVDGVNLRCKYRIRCYNDKDDYICLERKLKNGQYIAKQSARLTRAQTEAIINGRYDFLLEDGQPLSREFYYECVSNVMRPRVIVDYEREPYVFEGGDVRITFDMNVRASVLGFSIFDPRLPSIPVLPPAHLILEVKFTDFLPGVIRKLLPGRGAAETSFSKFVLACEQVMPMFL